jgi:DnaJ-class molecular chaperone
MQDILDYYEWLDVDKSANLETLKKTYLAQALKWHPDKNTLGKTRCERAFQELSEAFYVLSDESLRKIHDECGFLEVRKRCKTYNLNSFSLENAHVIFNSVYRSRDPVSACLQDENWYENSEIYTGAPSRNSQMLRVHPNDYETTEVIETTMSKYISSPKNVEKSVKTVMVERGGRRVKKTITTVTRADGTQEIIEEEKEEPLTRNIVKS